MAPRKPRPTSVHHDWIGMIQPEGLVVSAAVLDDLDLYVRQPPEAQQRLRELVPDGVLPDLTTLLHGVLGWKPERVAPATDELRVDLVELGVTLCPASVARDVRGGLIALLGWVDDDLDDTPSTDRWPTSHTERFVRNLTATGNPVGVLASPTAVRLVYAPAGQAPGWLTFTFAELHATDGRLLVDALHMLLGPGRLFNAAPGKSLREVLEASRARQENVTIALAGQVEDALSLLLDGVDAADARTAGRLLSDVPDDALYDGLTTVLLRLVFLLYAEDRGLLPMDQAVYAEHYSVLKLGEQLQADAVAHGEAISRRFGAWARLLSLFRMVWSGAQHHALQLPPRQGDLFHPDRFPFLEGRPAISSSASDPVVVPPIDDGVIAGVLEHLLHLDGQRVSFRNLEVEQIGSVYEAMMGFVVRRAASVAIPLKGDVWVELGALAAAPEPVLHVAEITGDRAAKLRAELPALDGWKPTTDAAADQHALTLALTPRIDTRRQPRLPGRHYLQPGEARRRSGSHYTPRKLTEPLVRRALDPHLGKAPTPDQILALRVVDPAMGSGAFLAEACRQLGDRLVEAWGRTGTLPPDDHDPTLVARRKVAETCLYGVDKNPRAVQLARLSLWLVTSAADLPFTFVDHALKEGDALIGLEPAQIAAFDLSTAGTQAALPFLEAAMASAARTRAGIGATQQKMQFVRQAHDKKKTLLTMADEEVWDERRLGDVLLAVVWAGGSAKEQRDRRLALEGRMRAWYQPAPLPDDAKKKDPKKEPLRAPQHAPLPELAAQVYDALPMRPFHWALEFPEVFAGKTPGFDVVIGNPPFGGKNTIVASNGDEYIRLLQALWPHAHGNADLCAYFFLRAARILRAGGTFGLVATNTISQGDTLDTGLRYLTNLATKDRDRVTITDATRDLKWPVAGAAVVVHTLNAMVGKPWEGGYRLDDQEVDGISSTLTAGDELAEPVALAANADRCFQGTVVLGKGFVLTPEEAERLIAADPRNGEIIKPYLGGQELNSNVPLSVDGYIPHDRYVIDFGSRTLEEARAWPELLAIVERLVKPERETNNRENYRRLWWQFGERRPGLSDALVGRDRCLACSIVSKYLLFGMLPASHIFSHKLSINIAGDFGTFALLQSSTHEAWTRAFSSTMKTDLNYTPSRCFETFPFPKPSVPQRAALAATGEALHRARQAIMVRDQQGMTKVWNRLHDPYDTDPAIVELRELREAMDRAVLAAYGWSELSPDDGPAILTKLRGLNARRARDEAAAAAEGAKAPKKTRSKS